MTNGPIIVWFRQDLRLQDNPALIHAHESGKPILPVFIYDDQSPDIRPYGSAQKWWLNHSLISLSQSLEKLGQKLILLRGPAEEIMRDQIKNAGATAICWNRRYGKGEQAVDASLKTWAQQNGIEAKSFGGMLLHEPSVARTQSGNPYKVYTPFWRKFSSEGQVRPPFPAPTSLKPFDAGSIGERIEDWQLLPTTPNWAADIATEWTPGEVGAAERTKQFVAENLRDYNTMRDKPGPDRTSKLSPHLRFGEISPYQLWHACFDANVAAGEAAREVWAKELVWREFSYHLLHHWPDLHHSNFRSRFDTFPWKQDDIALKAWQTGQTGTP